MSQAELANLDGVVVKILPRLYEKFPEHPNSRIIQDLLMQYGKQVLRFGATNEERFLTAANDYRDRLKDAGISDTYLEQFDTLLNAEKPQRQ